MSTDIGVWIAAFLTLCIFSFLYKDNPFYKFAEHLFVGVSVGYGIVLTIHQGIIPFAWQPLKNSITGEAPLWRFFVTLIPVGVGFLFFSRLMPRYSWLIRYPIAILIGMGAGFAIPRAMETSIFEQMNGTLRPFGVINSLSAGEIIGAVLMLIGVVCTLTYFFFSVEHKGIVGGISKLGIIFLMIGFGSAFGNTVMGRVSLLIQRVDFLLGDWLGIVG